MKFITIGGLPAAGKTYTSKLLAKQYNFLALEFETLRCALYESRIPLELLIEWQKATMKFINEKLYKIIDELKSIKTEKDYINFCNKYEKLINYIPEFKNLKRDYVICSHAFINTIDFLKDERIKIDFKADKNILIERFKKRENITEVTFDKNIELYYKSSIP